MNELSRSSKSVLNDFQVRILVNENCADKVYRLRLDCPELAQNSKPGQFINVRISNSRIPLLRRPFSIHRVNIIKGWIEILFDIRGKGTRLLSQLQPDEFLDVLGPLGNTFTVNEKKKSVLFVGGGLGIAPFLFLCQTFHETPFTVKGFYGTRTKSQFCCLNDFSDLNIALELATEDGSLGFKGFVTGPLEYYINHHQNDIHNCVIFACGPPAMLRKIQSLSQKWEIETQISLETVMACGIGICVGCAVEMKNPKPDEDKYRLVCKNGPIFRAEEVLIAD